MKQLFMKLLFPIVVLIVCISILILLDKYTAIENTTQIKTENTLNYASESDADNYIDEASQSDAINNQIMNEQSENLNTKIKPYSWWQEWYKEQLVNKLTDDNKFESIKTQLPLNTDMVWLATDIHYYPSEMTDYGEAFQEEMDRDDGKDIKDISKIIDAWIDTAIYERPATVILSGDLTLNGELKAHTELASKLKRLSDEGIQVLIIPGNHDINNNNAAVYMGNNKIAADTIDAKEFIDIYHQYGYDQSYSRDKNSLSYIYKIDDKHWFMMLDSAVYYPNNKVYGTIQDETLIWMRQMFEEAKADGAQIIPVAHHNLLNESKLYTNECTLTNYKEVAELLDEYNIPLWLSGHLHLQRSKSYIPEPGADKSIDRVDEMVTAAFSMYPFKYGKILWKDTIQYDSATVLVENIIKDNGFEIFKNVIEKQIKGDIRAIPDDMKVKMAEAYADLLTSYVAGIPVNQEEYRSQIGYTYMEKYLAGTKILDNVDAMLIDCKFDYNHYEHK